MHTHPLGEDAYPAPEVLTAPRGNADSPFFVDYRGRMILELDKQRLVRRDVHHLFSGVVPADYQCVGDRLLLAVTAECLLLGQDARDGRVTLHAGEELMFPTMMAADRSSGGLCVTTVERVPAGSTPLRHWLKAFDPDMHLRSSVDMGPRFVRSMTILDQARLAVFVDHNQGVFHHAL